MGWVTLDTSRESGHRDLLLKLFPVDVSALEKRVHKQWSSGWTRALDDRWLSEHELPAAWLQVETGNIVLVESIGAEEREGVVVARLWMPALRETIELLPPNRSYYTESPSPVRRGKRAAVLALVVDEVRSIAGLGLPVASDG